MSALTVELPDELHAKAREVALAKHLSMDAMISIALAQTLSRMVADSGLEARAARSTGEGIQGFLNKSSSADTFLSDRLPEGYERKK